MTSSSNTTWQFDGTEDTIDSREIMERIEELEVMRKPWTAGYNMPGYMPDNEPDVFEEHEEAISYLVNCIERHIEETEAVGDRLIDIEETLRRLKATHDGVEFGETVDGWHYWIIASDRDGMDPDDYEELKALKALEAKASSAPDWQRGETLIHDGYFQEYIEELIDVCYPKVAKALQSSEWPMTCLKMDWEQAARDARVDYMDVTFNGSTYWIRS